MGEQEPLVITNISIVCVVLIWYYSPKKEEE